LQGVCSGVLRTTGWAQSGEHGLDAKSEADQRILLAASPVASLGAARDSPPRWGGSGDRCHAATTRRCGSTAHLGAAGPLATSNAWICGEAYVWSLRQTT